MEISTHLTTIHSKLLEVQKSIPRKLIIGFPLMQSLGGLVPLRSPMDFTG